MQPFSPLFIANQKPQFDFFFFAGSLLFPRGTSQLPVLGIEEDSARRLLGKGGWWGGVGNHRAQPTWTDLSVNFAGKVSVLDDGIHRTKLTIPLPASTWQHFWTTVPNQQVHPIWHLFGRRQKAIYNSQFAYCRKCQWKCGGMSCAQAQQQPMHQMPQNARETSSQGWQTACWGCNCNCHWRPQIVQLIGERSMQNIRWQQKNSLFKATNWMRGLFL